jgi:hypothetical protein
MIWEHKTEPLAPTHVFASRFLAQFLIALALVAVGLAIGMLGYTILGKLSLIDAFLESSMLLSGAGPLYTERTSSNTLKIFSSIYSLFSTLVVVLSVGLLASPVVHRLFHAIHIEKTKKP